MKVWFLRALVLAALGGWLYFAYPEFTRTSDSSVGVPSEDSHYEIVTILRQDGIRAIDEPEFYAAAEADQQYEDDELILGVVFDGDARAYSIDLLSRHEIVNDTVGGRPIAVTW